MEIKNLAKALVSAQAMFAPALKTSTNPHFKSRYADLSACVEAVIDALNQNGIALVQKTKPCSGGVCVETVFIHESGESMDCGELFVPAEKSDPQKYGSALTYARRYSLMAACGIAPEDDDGNAASRKGKDKEFSPGVISAPIEAFKSLPKNIQNDLTLKTKGVDEAMPDVKKASELFEVVIESQDFDDENMVKTAAWALLDSKTRSAIKYYKASQNGINQ